MCVYFYLFKIKLFWKDSCETDVSKDCQKN